MNHSEVEIGKLLSCYTAEVKLGKVSCPSIPARLLYVVVPSSDSLSELSCFRAAIRLSFIFLCQRENRCKERPQGLFGGLQDHKMIINKLQLSDQTYLGDPFFAPLTDSFADTDYTLYSPV